MKVLCELCKQEIGEIIQGVPGITAPSLRDSKSGSTFYLPQLVTVSGATCEDCRKGMETAEREV
jgi:copper chaperone CopZ